MRGRHRSVKQNPWRLGRCGRTVDHMLVVLFRSRLTDNAGADYTDLARELLDYARTRPGFVDFKSFTADDGERLSVVWWRDEETLAAWRADARHRIAQRIGRARWYRYFRMEVARVIRETNFDRHLSDPSALELPETAA